MLCFTRIPPFSLPDVVYSDQGLSAHPQPGCSGWIVHVRFRWNVVLLLLTLVVVSVATLLWRQRPDTQQVNRCTVALRCHINLPPKATNFLLCLSKLHLGTNNDIHFTKPYFLSSYPSEQPARKRRCLAPVVLT